jgi:hypothetical protein
MVVDPVLIASLLLSLDVYVGQLNGLGWFWYGGWTSNPLKNVNAWSGADSYMD